MIATSTSGLQGKWLLKPDFPIHRVVKSKEDAIHMPPRTDDMVEAHGPGTAEPRVKRKNVVGGAATATAAGPWRSDDVHRMGTALCSVGNFRHQTNRLVNAF